MEDGKGLLYLRDQLDLGSFLGLRWVRNGRQEGAFVAERPAGFRKFLGNWDILAFHASFFFLLLLWHLANT